MGIPLFEAFDYSNSTSPLPERPTTTVAPQALMLLNDEFMQEQADAFARRLMREAGPDEHAQLRRAYAVALNRLPASSEMEITLKLLQGNKHAFAALSTRNTFQLDVPNALSTEYLAKLAPTQFLTGPSAGWSYYRGVWAPPYEGISVSLRDQAPFALLKSAAFKDGAIETDLLFSNSTEMAALLFRAKAEGDAVRGYELLFSPRKNQIALRRHAKTLETLALADAQLPIGKPLHLKVSIEGKRVAVWLRESSQALLEVEDQKAVEEAGAIGVRTWGGPLTLENLEFSPSSAPRPTRVAGEYQDADRRALESVCLLLLNLNELIYID
jgi:hypothetical protein